MLCEYIITPRFKRWVGWTTWLNNEEERKGEKTGETCLHFGFGSLSRILLHRANSSGFVWPFKSFSEVHTLV